MRLVERRSPFFLCLHAGFFIVQILFIVLDAAVCVVWKSPWLSQGFSLTASWVVWCENIWVGLFRISEKPPTFVSGM